MASDDLTRVYETAEIAIDWRAGRCVHSAVCLQGLPAVFDVRRRPWVVPDQAAADAIAQVVSLCPSGALHFRRLDNGLQEAPDAEPSVMTVPNGPLALRGAITLTDADGKLLRQDTRMALCRCGASANKPFCDASHRRIGFQAP